MKALTRSVRDRVRAACVAGCGPLARISTVRYAAASTRLFFRVHGASRTSEIAYYSILSVVPFGALLLSIVAFAAGDMLETGWTFEDVSRTMGELAFALVPEGGTDISGLLAPVVERRGTLGLVGLGALLMTGSLVFGAISRALAAIFEVRVAGRFTTTFLAAIGLMVLSILVILGLPVFAGLMTLFRVEGVGDAAKALQPALVPLFGVVVLALVFVFLVVAVVKTRIAARHTIAGAAFFAATFALARFGFAVYLEQVADYSVIYGSLGGLMAVVLWAWVVSFGFLAAMCLVRVLHDRLHETEMGELVLP